MISSSDRGYCDEPYVSRRWDSLNQWVVAEWKGWAKSAEFRAAHITALVAIRENQATKWLVDSLDQKAVVEADQRWLTETWIPSIVRAGIRRTAIVVPKSAITRSNVESVNRAAKGDLEDAPFFATLDQAKGWLAAP